MQLKIIAQRFWMSALQMSIACAAICQSAPVAAPVPDSMAPPVAPIAKFEADIEAIKRANRDGIEVRIKSIGHFRGVRSNQILGYGLVVGLEGTGDTRKTPFTSTLLANAIKKFGTMLDANQLNAKNVATVAITAELPPFASPGNRIDVTVQSIGDAKSLQGGTLLQSPLYGANDDTRAIVVAQGPISIGGFNVSSGGSSVQKNHVNVGVIPGGGIVESAVAYQMVFEGNKMYLDLDEGDLTTAQRIAEKLAEKFPQYAPSAIDGGTIEICIPTGVSPVEVCSKIESATVFADIPAEVVVNERTGVIIIGGDVKLGPAIIVQGNLQVMIQKDPIVSQPAPFGQGQTKVVEQVTVGAEEDMSQLALVSPNATIADLAKVLGALKVSPRDTIAILQALKAQGALKARIKQK